MRWGELARDYMVSLSDGREAVGLTLVGLAQASASAPVFHAVYFGQAGAAQMAVDFVRVEASAGRREQSLVLDAGATAAIFRIERGRVVSRTGVAFRVLSFDAASGGLFSSCQAGLRGRAARRLPGLRSRRWRRPG